MKLLLDSVILIDYFNGITDAIQFVNQHHHDCAISVITFAEVLAGFEGSDFQVAKNFLQKFPILPITLQVAEEVAILRRKERWKLPDALHAAVATHHKVTFITRNTKDFRTEQHNFVSVPYTI